MIPAGPVLGPQQALDHTHIRTAGSMQDVHHPGLPKLAPVARSGPAVGNFPTNTVRTGHAEAADEQPRQDALVLPEEYW
jgi:hypothetical protein